MTTLPQTTAIRLPRLQSGSQITVPVAPAAVMGAAPGAVQMTAADVWRVLRAHLWLIIIALIVSGGLGYGVNYYLAKWYPKYDAIGLLEVKAGQALDPLGRELNRQPDANAIELEVRTQVQILKGESLMSKAVQNAEIRETAWFKRFEGDLEQIRKYFKDNFTVAPIVDTRLIRVEFSASIAREAKLILEQTINEHIMEQNKNSTMRLQDRFTLVNKIISDEQTALDSVQSELKEASKKLTRGGVGFSGMMGMLDMRKTDLMRDKNVTDRDFDLARTSYEKVVAMLNRGEEPPQLTEYLRLDPSLTSLRGQVEAYDAELAKVKAVSGDLSEIVQRLTKQRDALQERLDNRMAQQKADAKVTMTESMKTTLEDLQRRRDDQQKQLGELVAEMETLNAEYANYQRNLDKEKQILERIRLAEDNKKMLDTVERNVNARVVDWMTTPETPWRMAFPRLPITMSLALFLGLSLSVGLAFLRETMDTSIRSPRDIAKVGQLNLLGMVPDENDDPQSMGGRLPLIIFDAPNSLMAEQFRQVRTRLQHAASLDTTRSLLVTSPGPGDGKTTVAVNLAAGLALNGRRILLVDANFRRPELHRVFDLANDQGFSDVLASVDNFEQAVRETQVPNLSILTTGARPANATELLESQLLIDFIERALEQYDHVIFDSGPLLMVSETVALAPRVDGVVTVVRAKTNSRGVLQRMRDELKKTKAEHLGVVLNGVRAQGGGYYARNIKTYYEYNS